MEKYLSLVETLRERGLRVGVAPHSVRACPRDWLEAIGAYAARESLPLHVHADEQPREVEECLAEHGRRPIELLHDTGCLGPHTTVIHATEASDGELDLLAETGTRVCLCPTTEANLGDGFAPVERLLERGIGICIGSDSNVRIDPLEELREIEAIARRASGRRGVVPLDTLLCAGADEGAAALGLDEWPGDRDRHRAPVAPGHRRLRPARRRRLRLQRRGGGRMSYRWSERAAELALDIEAASPEEVFTEAAAALGELVGGDDMGGEPVTRTIALAAVTVRRAADALARGARLPRRHGVVRARAVRLNVELPDLDATVTGHRGTPRRLVKAVTRARARVRARRRHVAGPRRARQKLGIR